MDAIEALERTLELWEWLAATGSRDKQNWPGWKQVKQSVLFHCYLCEYTRGKCQKCPLYGKWDGALTCTTKDAPFDNWTRSEHAAYSKGIKAYAQVIVDLCRDELARRRKQTPRGT